MRHIPDTVPAPATRQPVRITIATLAQYWGELTEKERAFIQREVDRVNERRGATSSLTSAIVTTR